jgi:gluconate 2-dehydrogenase alpha chain
MNGTTPDICIMGLGAAGSVAASVLATAGLRVLALEAGPELDSSNYLPDELQAAYARGGYGQKFASELQTWRPNPGVAASPARYSLGKMANGVGGSTQIFGVWLRRYQHHDFAIRSSTVARYGEAALPARSVVVDWPITYDDLEPYYTKTEQMLGVAGIAGNVRGEPVPGGNPFEPYRSEALPLPPVRRTWIGNHFDEATRRLGYHPYPVPVSINSEPFDGRPACTYCGWCTFYICHNGAKTTAANTFVAKARATNNLEVRANCRVLRLNAASDGTVRSVDYLDPEGRVVRQHAPRFILSSYTFENVRLLLTSTSDAFPNGLGNTTGQVGKYFMTKQYQTILGLFEGKRLNRFAAAGHQASILDDFVGDNFDHTGLGFIRGATISCETQLQPIGAARMPTPPGVPRWGAAYKEHLLTNWNSIADCRVQPETLPYEDTFLDLDPSVRDRSGIGMPVIRITWDIHPNEHRMMTYLEERVRAIYAEMGADLVWAGDRFTGAGSAHDLGGCRMGTDRAKSVVDPSLRLHDSPNLYVMSGAVFPSGGGINPTLTLQALCWRAAEGLAK